MIFIESDPKYSVLNLGFDLSLVKSSSLDVTPELGNVITSGVAPKSVISGGLVSDVAQEAGTIFSGKTTFDNTAAGYILGIDESDGLLKFYIGDSSNYLNWTGSALNISGAISAGSIDIGGADATSFHVDANGNMWLGAATFAAAPFSVSNAGVLIATSATITGAITATSGSFGGFTIGADYLRDAADSMGLASTVTGGDDVRFWAGSTFANRATAPFRVTEAGTVTGSSVTISGGSVATSTLNGIVGQTNLNVANAGWVQTSAFTVTDADTISWGAGTFTASNGASYSIGAGNTGNMAAKTYIYLDTAVSTTAYQITTTATTANGAGKVLIAVAQNGTGEATFFVMNDKSANIDASSIVANSITANELSTSITYAGAIIIDTAGLIRSGQTAFDTGTGWFIGNVSGTPKLSIGIGGSTSASLTWDGTNLTVNGYVITTIGSFGGNGSDGALTISSGTTTISAGSAAEVVKNYTSISITGTGKLAFSTPATKGTFITLKSKGAVTLTSSTAPNIDVSSMGATGGTGGGDDTNGTNGSDSDDIGDALSHFGGFGGKGIHQVGAGPAAGPAGAVGAALSQPLVLYANPKFGLRWVVPGAGGGGGGGGGLAGGGTPSTAGNGGAAGGALVIECGGALNFTATIHAKGAAGSNATAPTNAPGAGGGGGGSGGMVLVIYNTLTSSAGTISVNGGAGGNGSNANDTPGGDHRSGGGGGGGGGLYAGAGGAGGAGGSDANGANGVAGAGATGGALGTGGTVSNEDGGGGGGGGGAEGLSRVVQNTTNA